ncbi:MAG: hypothetical protein ABSB74_03300 [Tepidisphaeraceae bacterium]
MERLQPIQAKSVPSFGLVWLLTVVGASLMFPVISVLFVNYYKSEDPAWIDLLYRQKHVALQRRASEPRRLVIVGGSGALFGIDAELIEKKLHIPTVNFATHAGLGLRYLLDRAERELRSGDIVLLAAEYETWPDAYRDSEGPAFDYIWTYDKPYLASMNRIEAAKMISAVPWSQWPRSTAGWIDRIHGDYFHFRELSFYSVATLDSSGDIHVTAPSAKSQPPSFPFPGDPTLPAMQSIRQFGSFARSKGIQLLWTWPNIARPATLSQPPGFLIDRLQSSGFVILDQPADNAFPPDWFMDTPYHPNPCCRRVRTEELIRRLRPVLGLPPAPQKVTGLFLLAGTDHRRTDGNTFADHPGVVFRYLSPEPGLDAISPEAAAQLVRGGTPVYTDSEEARKLLASADLTLQLQSRQSLSIPEWFAQYPSCVFCVAAPPNHSLDPIWKSAIPNTIYRQLATGAASAAMFSAGAAPILGGEINQQRLQSNAIPCVVSIHTVPQAQIVVDDREFVSSPAGVCVVAIDPEMGIVVGSAIFAGGANLETWRLYRVAERTASGRAL